MPLSFHQQVTFLYVKDLEKSARFYGETLGLTMVLDQGPARIYRIGSGNAFLGICLSSAVQQAPPPDRAPLGVIVTFATDDVDGIYDELRAKGVAFETVPTVNATYKIYNCFFRDPDVYSSRSRSSWHQIGHAKATMHHSDTLRGERVWFGSRGHEVG